MAKKKINNYKFKPGIGYTENLFPNAYALLSANKAFLQAETGQLWEISWISHGVRA